MLLGPTTRVVVPTSLYDGLQVGPTNTANGTSFSYVGIWYSQAFQYRYPGRSREPARPRTDSLEPVYYIRMQALLSGRSQATIHTVGPTAIVCAKARMWGLPASTNTSTSTVRYLLGPGTGRSLGLRPARLLPTHEGPRSYWY